MQYLDRKGVSEDFTRGCLVAKLADMYLANFREQYETARSDSSLEHLKYIYKLRLWTEEIYNIPLKTLLKFEYDLFYNYLSVNKINLFLSKYNLPLRLSKDEKWVSFQSGDLKHGSDFLQDYGVMTHKFNCIGYSYNGFN